jgi:hypothetical protein
MSKQTTKQSKKPASKQSPPLRLNEDRFDVQQFKEEVARLTYNQIEQEVKRFIDTTSVFIWAEGKDVVLDWWPSDYDEMSCVRSLRQTIVKRTRFAKPGPSAREIDEAIMPLVRLLEKYPD